jgi:hypothetical protein
MDHPRSGQKSSSNFGTECLRIEPPHSTQGLFHLKTRQENFFYDQKSFDMLKTGFSGIWFSTLFGTPPYADFFLGKWAKMGYLANYCSVSPHFGCNDILY